MVPPALDQARQEELKGAVQQPPASAGIELANWYWKVVRQYVSERYGVCMSRSSCLNCLHRLGFAFKRPKKRLLKADAERREAFVAEYAALREEARQTGAKVFFADEAHFRADAELRGKWVLKGEPALRTRPGGLDQSALRGEGQLLLGSVPGDGGGGVDGTGGQQQLRNIGCLLEAVAQQVRRTAERDLGQRAGASRRDDERIPQDARAEPAAGESAGLQS